MNLPVSISGTGIINGSGTEPGVYRELPEDQARFTALEDLKPFWVSPFLCHLAPLMWMPQKNRMVSGQGKMDPTDIVGESSLQCQL